MSWSLGIIVSSASSSSATNSSASAGNSTGSDDGRYHPSTNGGGRNANQTGVSLDGKVLKIGFLSLFFSCAPYILEPGNFSSLLIILIIVKYENIKSTIINVWEINKVNGINVSLLNLFF